MWHLLLRKSSQLCAHRADRFTHVANAWLGLLKIALLYLSLGHRSLSRNVPCCRLAKIAISFSRCSERSVADGSNPGSPRAGPLRGICWAVVELADGADGPILIALRGMDCAAGLQTCGKHRDSALEMLRSQDTPGGCENPDSQLVAGCSPTFGVAGMIGRNDFEHRLEHARLCQAFVTDEQHSRRIQTADSVQTLDSSRRVWWQGERQARVDHASTLVNLACCCIVGILTNSATGSSDLPIAQRLAW